MGKYSKNSKTAGLVVAITVFASLLIFSVYFDGFSLETQVWLVNIFTALTFGSIVYFILHISKIASEAMMLLISAIVAVIFLFFNPITLPAEQESVMETVEKTVPENVEEDVDTVYQEIQKDEVELQD
ncbi:MAG: hypothetical protein ACNS60_07825 [Candidatus Cyclobacteriaceae bacterium M2_1C_046]